jgi:hypothetical protein
VTAVDGQLGLFGGGEHRLGAGVQLDLFGALEAAEEARARALVARSEWSARFTRVTFESPYDTVGAREGDLVEGIVCPACGGVEWNGYLLSINHGYDPDRPDDVPGSWAGKRFGQYCHRMRRAHRA